MVEELVGKSAGNLGVVDSQGKAGQAVVDIRDEEDSPAELVDSLDSLVAEEDSPVVVEDNHHAEVDRVLEQPVEELVVG